ncbi:MAG TPA: shikimate kinase [bacterium]|nr:shikimate kinase [bacterium]
MKIFIIGPGGVGKSTCGPILASKLDYQFIDLDDEFCQRIANIGAYINEKGYEKYCLENSQLFYDILSDEPDNLVFVLSSGFLVHEGMAELTAKHQQTIQKKGISILLLPSADITESTQIVVARQLTRGFGLNADKEKLKFQQRYKRYNNLGNIKIYSHQNPIDIANQMKKRILPFI